MILHITTEIEGFQIGGIGTVVSELFKNRNTNEKFVLVAKLPMRPAGVHQDVDYLNHIEYEKLSTFPENYEKIYFHSFHAVKRFQQKARHIFILHSNHLSEVKYTSRINENMVSKFARALSISDEIVTVAENELQRLKEQLKFVSTVEGKQVHWDLKKFGTIENGISFNSSQIEKWQPMAEKKEAPYGYIGRLDIRKGIFNLVADFPDDGTLWLACGGANRFFSADYQTLLATIKSRHAKNIIPIGYCGGNRKDSFFRSVRTIIIPSLYEPFGMTILEALSYGLAPIVVKLGGPLEIFGPKYPFYFDVGDSHSLVKAIRFFEQNQNLVDDFVKHEAPLLLQKYSSSNMIQKYRSY